MLKLSDTASGYIDYYINFYEPKLSGCRDVSTTDRTFSSIIMPSISCLTKSHIILYEDEKILRPVYIYRSYSWF